MRSKDAQKQLARTSLSQTDSDIAVKSIMEWAKDNRMSLNLKKKKHGKLLIKGKTEKDQPDPLQYIKPREYEGKRDNPSYWPYSHRHPS